MTPARWPTSPSANLSENHVTQAWVVLYVRNARIGSVPLADDNLGYLRKHLCLSLIQKDQLGGHEHYYVLGPRKTRKTTPRNRAVRLKPSA